MFYRIKKGIMLSNIRKRQKAGYDRKASELYTHPFGTPSTVNNSYFFTAHSLQGESLYIRLGIRGDDSREVWVGWYKNGRFIENEKEFYPSTTASPLSVECVEPEKVWNIKYNGKMKDVSSNGEKTYTASFELNFTANEEIFDFFYDNNPSTTAHAIASQKWSKGLFEEIQKNNQRHYEQCGTLTGLFTIDGEQSEISLAAARDHSFGPREWSYMDRHFWLLAIDGNGHCLNISMVDYPSVKGIWTGYTTMFGGVETVAKIQCTSDLNKEGHGEGKVHFDIILTNGKKIAVDTLREAEAKYYFGEGSYYFKEGIGHIMVDGRPARGTIEFGYNSDESRWIKR